LILDSSAVVAVLNREPGFEELERRMSEAQVVEIGAPTLVECALVVGKVRGEDGTETLARFIRRTGIRVLPFDEAHADLAAEAFLDYGKGRHPARLNYGDCMTYATARRAERALLFTGEDFAQTDIQAA
jgi:ribonuclease VapC